MGAPTRANIMKSGAVIWYAPEGEALPDETSVNAGASWGGTWVRVGFTAAPVTFLYEDERMEIEVQEMLVAFDEWRTKESCTLTTALAEITGEYLALLTGDTVTTVAAGASQKGYEHFSVGNNDRVKVYAVGFEGIRYDANNNALPFRLFIPRATFKMDGEIEFSRRTDVYVNLPITIKGLGDTSTGKVAIFQRVTAAATS